MTSRAPVTDVAVAERPAESRRRANRARGAVAERPAESRRRAERARSVTPVPAPEPTAEQPAAAAPRLSYGVDSVATSAPAMPAEGEAMGELPQPAAAPEAGISAEQVAQREAQVAAAQAAVDSAADTPGLMNALADAPPTVKAQVSGELGSRFDRTLSQDSQALQQETPELRAEMQGNTPAPAGQIAAPAADVTLEEAPAEEPAGEELVGEPLSTEEEYQANDAVVGQLARSFSPEGGAEDIDRALGSVQTTDPSIATSPGTAPAIPLEGATDPQRIENQIGAGSQQAQAALADQQAQVEALPGAERVQLADVHEAYPIGELPAPSAEEGPAPEGAQQYLGLNQPPEVQTAFDEVAGPSMQESMAEARNQIDQAAQERDQQHQDAVDQAQRDTAAAEEQARSDQNNAVTNSRREIETQRQSTLGQQQAAVADVEQQAADRSRDDRQQIDDRVRDDQAQLDGRYQQAETDAEGEVQRGEREAEAERQRAEREAEDQSWWEAALDFITDLFDALVSLINDIFDAVRAAVNAILDAVRDFALALIDLAANFLKGLISAFGEFLKGLVQGLLGDLFPELAQRLTEFIDSGVELANSAIDAVADTLKTAVNAIVETLRAGINRLIDIYQAAVNTGLALMRAALTGDWGAFIIQLIEAACRVAGLDPQAVFAFIGRTQETIQLIVDNPGQFLSNLVAALTGGIQRFADNFLTHLQAGIIGWLTGAIGSAGITLPERFDLIGVISLVAQILGLTWQNLRLRLVRVIGERGVQVLEFVASYLQTLIEGGWSALWERIQNDLAMLRDMVLEQIRNFLVERLIMAAITRLATLFNPVGALVNILLAAYNFYTFIRDQLQRIMQVVTTVLDAIGNIARGVLGPAQERVESFLASLLPLALDLLARLIGLGNVGERVREILQSVQDTVWGTIDRLINWVVGLFRGGAGGAAGEPVAQGAAGTGAITVGTDIPIPVAGDETHHLFFVVTGQNAVLTIRSESQPVLDLLNTWERSLNYLETQRQQQASTLITQTHGLVTTTDRQADVVAVARYRALQQTPERTEANREASEQEAQLTPGEEQIATNLRQLFPWFMDDPRAVASRFEQANSLPVFETPFTTATWQTAFDFAPSSARRDLQWGRENAKVTVQGNNYLLALSDDDLVPLAARVISAGGRLSATLGHGRPFFVANDVRQFCIAAERLPNDPNRYPDTIVQRIFVLLQQRAEITEDTTTRGQYIFAEIPERRGIPSTFDSDRYRRHFYLNGSAFASERATIIRDELPRITAAVDDLTSGDPVRQARGQEVWDDLIDREAVYSDRPFSAYNPNALKDSSNWAADHIIALAFHWQNRTVLGDPGNNTGQERRQEVAGGDRNLRIMWGPKNSAEQARGGRYVNYVLRNFTSLVTRTKGPAYVDYEEKFVEYELR